MCSGKISGTDVNGVLNMTLTYKRPDVCGSRTTFTGSLHFGSGKGKGTWHSYNASGGLYTHGHYTAVRDS
jgi:hypothetical protein